MSYQCAKPSASLAGGLCTGCEANKTKYEAPYKTRPPWHGLITEAPPPDAPIFWLASYRNHPTKKTMPKWCPDGYKVASAPPKAVITGKAVAAPADANEGQLKLIDGFLVKVINGNVYEYDELAEKAGDFMGRLTAEETIDTDAEEVVPEAASAPASALSLLEAAMARAKQDAEELSALRASTTSTASLTATVAALREENAALKAKLDTVKALFTA